MIDGEEIMMTTDQLKEYLSIVLDLEENIYIQKTLIENIEARLSSPLGEAHTFVKPNPPALSEKHFYDSIPVCIAVTFTGVIIAFLSSVIFNGIGGFFYNLLQVFAPIGGILIAFLGIAWLIGSFFRKSEYAKTYRKAKENYAIAMRKYEQNVYEDDARIRSEAAEKVALTSNLSELKKQLSSSENNLNAIYAKNIIFPKYRNLVMISSIYEYFCSGRCSTLEGHEGAYNILENEIRLDRIITQFDKAISLLGQIRQNQFMLYSAINESNNRISGLMASVNNMSDKLKEIAFKQGQNSLSLQASVDQLQKNSEIAVYQAERIQKELSYMNRMNYLSGRNSSTFFNLPPT